MSLPELKACPFCGKSPIGATHTITCTSCGVSMDRSAREEIQHFYVRWNTRQRKKTPAISSAIKRNWQDPAYREKNTTHLRSIASNRRGRGIPSCVPPSHHEEYHAYMHKIHKSKGIPAIVHKREFCQSLIVRGIIPADSLTEEILRACTKSPPKKGLVNV